jgi:hypothetical protein
MANNLVLTEANRYVDAGLGTATYTAPTGPMRVALMTANGTNTAAGTEVTGGSYAKQTVTFAAASAGAAASSNALNFTGMPAVTVTGLDVVDSAGTPRRVWTGALSVSKVVGAGDTLSFAIGALTVGLG